MGTFDTVPIHLVTPPANYPPIYASTGSFKVGAAVLAGAVAGAVGGAALIAGKKLPEGEPVAAGSGESDKHNQDSSNR